MAQRHNTPSNIHSQAQQGMKKLKCYTVIYINFKVKKKIFLNVDWKILTFMSGSTLIYVILSASYSISNNGTNMFYPSGRDSPNMIGPQGNLQLSQDLSGFLDTSLKLIKHI